MIAQDVVLFLVCSTTYTFNKYFFSNAWCRMQSHKIAEWNNTDDFTYKKAYDGENCRVVDHWKAS